MTLLDLYEVMKLVNCQKPDVMEIVFERGVLEI